jgi:cyclopropane-fatty-acyl-phospholipid synthase
MSERSISPIDTDNDNARAFRPFDALALRLLERLLGDGTVGRITVTLPSGRARSFGQSGTGHRADLTIRSWRMLWRALTRGTVGFAESYVSGEVETTDLAELFGYFIDNYERLMRVGGAHMRIANTDRRYHRRRANTRTGSRRNIAAHYDLGNAFYALWLDSGMTYSSALYRNRKADLETAQDAKYARVLELLDLKAPANILEIGCGWGGFAEGALAAGHRVVGLTLSREQHAYASKRLAVAGERADIRIEDYRDATGSYDAIASIEMIEAVGEEHWPHYFSILSERLRAGGVAVLQAITIHEAFFEDYRRNPDFIQRYIFPGGMLPTRAVIAAEAARAGLVLDHQEQFGLSYALTLDAWLERFRANWPAIAALGFDERFRRMWEYYLIYCATGFRKGTIDVGLYRLRKPVSQGEHHG